MQYVLVAGATGFLGRKVVMELLKNHKKVRALVRPGSDARSLSLAGVDIVRGDLLEPDSLVPAMYGIDAVVTTAIGYSRRQPGDSLKTDDKGNRNLIDAAQRAGIQRFVFTSILTCDRATSVPHFHQKFLTEQYLERANIPFVALRPGGFIDTLLDFNRQDIARGRFRVMADPDAIASTIHSDDVARYLAQAVDTPTAVGKYIDIATQEPTTLREIAQTLSQTSERDIKLQVVPAMLRATFSAIAGVWSPTMADNAKAMSYVSSGQYVADISRQAQLWDVPTLEDSIRRWVKANSDLWTKEV